MKKRILETLRNKFIIFWIYAELNRFKVGRSHFPWHKSREQWVETLVATAYSTTDTYTHHLSEIVCTLSTSFLVEEKKIKKGGHNKKN